jgi:hypothetical protein
MGRAPTRRGSAVSAPSWVDGASAPTGRLEAEIADQRTSGLQEPVDGRPVVGSIHGALEVAVDVLDGARQHPQAVVQIVQPGSRDDDLVFVQAAFGRSLARLVVALAAALAAVRPRSAGPGAGGQGSLAPAAPDDRLPCALL